MKWNYKVNHKQINAFCDSYAMSSELDLEKLTTSPGCIWCCHHLPLIADQDEITVNIWTRVATELVVKSDGNTH